MPVLRGDRYRIERLDPAVPGSEAIVEVFLDDLIVGSAEADEIYGGYGYNILHGGDGGDKLHADGGSSIPFTPQRTAAVDAILGSEAAIGYGALYGEAGNDILYGGAKADILDGGGDVDQIRGGGGDDLIRGSSGADDVDGGAGSDTIVAVADGQQIALSRALVERISAAGHSGVTILGSSGLDLSGATLDGIVAIRSVGSLTASAGDDFIIAQGGGTLTGGAGNDVFDLTELGDIVPPGIFVRVHGRTDHEAPAPIERDELILPGAANQYQIYRDVSGTGMLNDHVISREGDSILSPAVATTGIDIVRFNRQADNVVKVEARPIDNASAETHILGEQLRLVSEVYREDGEATAIARTRHWHALSALELGIPFAHSEAGRGYTLNGGEYRAFAPNLLPSSIRQFVPGDAEGVASVLLGIVAGKRTVALTFRGTDQAADVGDYRDFSAHYEKFAPLIAALDSYVADPRNGIEQVLVSGHSLGGAMVQEFMATHPQGGGTGIAYLGMTIGSPGSDNSGRFLPDARIVNFGHAADPFFLLGDGDNDLIVKVALASMLAAAAAALGPTQSFGRVALDLAAYVLSAQDKERQGGDVRITHSLDIFDPLDHHEASLYEKSASRILAFAFDDDSPFYDSDLARTLHGGGPYGGLDLDLAVIIGETYKLTVGAGPRYVLGGDADEEILLTAPSGQIIDGGDGEGDRLIVQGGAYPDFHMESAGEVTRLWNGTELLATVAHVETLVIDANGRLQYLALDGRQPVVQSVSGFTETMSVSAAADYVLTANVYEVYDSSDDDVLITGRDSQTIRTRSGHDTIFVGSDGIDAGKEIRIVPTGQSLTVSNRSGTDGKVVVDLGLRAAWAVTEASDGSLMLLAPSREDTPSGLASHRGALQLIGDVEVRFNNGTAGAPTAERQVLFGTNARDVLDANGVPTHFFGGWGGAIMYGSDGDDIFVDGSEMYGGGGNDVYALGYNGTIHEEAGGGRDLVYWLGRDFTLPENVEDLILPGWFGAGPGPEPELSTGTGNALANVITGGWGREWLRGGGGNDTISGGERDDILFGDDGDDLLYGGLGDDILNGGAGKDIIYDGSGANLFVFIAASDSSVSAPDQIESFETGLDKIDLIALAATGVSWVASGAYQLVTVQLSPGTMSFLVKGPLAASDFLLKRATFNGTPGNDLVQGTRSADILNGGAGADRMEGGLGDDWYYVDNVADRVVESAGQGNDRVFASVSYTLGAGVSVEVLTTGSNTGTAALNLTGNQLANTIYGNDGANLLNGGGGADTMVGRLGNDFYYVDNSADRLIETAGQGSDRVVASVSYTLEAAAEVELLVPDSYAGTAALNLTGNGFANTIYGNDGANILDGKAGADTLVGRLGDDWYYVDNPADRIVERAGEGSLDRLFASVSYTLGAGVYVEVMRTSNDIGTAAINLTGNEIVQTIYGNAGANILDGKGGADILSGLGGNDFYYMDNAGDRALEGAGGGSDRIFASVSYALGAGVQVELMTTSNNALTTAINLTGNEIAQTIYGNAGANILDGKAGADTLVGLGGADQFRFTTAPGGGNVDRITDFVSGTDRIALDDAVFKALGPGALPAGAFVTGTAAADASDRIIYDGATGRLYYDADGSGAGAAVLFATLDGHPTLTASDFVVI